MCKDCILSLLEIVRKMKRAGATSGTKWKCKPTACVALSRAVKVVGKSKMPGFKDFF